LIMSSVIYVLAVGCYQIHKRLSQLAGWPVGPLARWLGRIVFEPDGKTGKRAHGLTPGQKI